MKEFEYKDVKGTEALNLPRQLDIFEAPGAKTLKDRYIFDFSTPMITSEGITTQKTDWFWKNFTQNGESWDYYSGNPGNANLMVDGLPKWSNEYPSIEEGYASNGIVQSYDRDILDSVDVPLFSEDSIIYIDEEYIETYDAAGSANYMKSFRSGYVEFTIKTDKKNSIIGMGSARYVNYGGAFRQYTTGGSEAEKSGALLNIGSATIIDEESAYLNEDLVNVDSLYINLNNGKIELKYKNEYGETQKDFTIIGNIDVADGQWHHIVINFGKPGTLKSIDKKHNNRFIEIWVDGKIDKRDTEYVNKHQVFFPLVEWLLMDPLLINQTNVDDFWRSPNIEEVNGSGVNLFSNLSNRVFENAKATAFRGSMHHFMSGLNYALSPYQIQQRNRLYRNYTQNTAETFSVNAEMISPVVSGNKKKALKLFWNNLVETSKGGVELDNNFVVNSYSVTHQIVNSATEVYNVDVANEKTINYLADVRVALKDNIFIFGPGLESLFGKQEVWNAQIGEQQQFNAAWIGNYDALNSVDTDFSVDIKSKFTSSAIKNMSYSGVDLKADDRILLTNQFNPRDNGIYIFNGPARPLTRATDADSAAKITNAVVRVVDGYYKDTSWMLSNNVSSLNDGQEWSELESHPTSQTINSQPIFKKRWANEQGIERFIDLEQDINIQDYDLIVFMNYPENSDQINNSFIGFEKSDISKNYANFIKSLQNVVANGASLYVSSTMLAEDLKIVKAFESITQEVEAGDGHSSETNPFETGKPAENYFDTHRQNIYHLNTEIDGLTNKETYVLTDFISYLPENSYEFNEYHAKYSYRQFGLVEGNEFIIPGLSLTVASTNESLPGFKNNQATIKDISVVKPSDLITGTVVTSLANNHYHGDDLVVNEYDDYISTIVVHDGQLLDGQPVSGKIFVNCIEDGYTFSREEYNRAVIQQIPDGEISETTSTRAWQYSTSRLNRIPNRSNIAQITEYGQTSPTNGGGGPLIQAQTNSSNGVIRSESDRGNVNYQSDMYTKIEEEVYELQEIPVLSMTWLGLQWLAE